MEFERSVFRVHERFLKGPNVKSCLQKTYLFFLGMTVLSLVNFVIFHNMFVSNHTALKQQIENQLKPFFWKQIEMKNLMQYN